MSGRCVTKALTICQPYAHLICLPDTDPSHKRVENRNWSTSYRGPLLIHAGKSRSYLEVPHKSDTAEDRAEYNYGIPLEQLVFGAFVAQCNLVDCIHIDSIRMSGRPVTGNIRLRPIADLIYESRYPWLRDHQHTEGTWCWVLQDVRPLPKPIPWSGKQGLWNVDEALLFPPNPGEAVHLHENGDGV